MQDPTLYLVFGQSLGASIGAVMSLWGEYAYLRAMRDSVIDVAERAHLDTIASGLRVGMTLLLLSSLGLVIISYTGQATVQPALTSVYWALVTLALLVTGVSWALSRRYVSSTLGSATLFTAWWFLSYLTLGWLSPLSFGTMVALFVVATAVVYGLFYYMRRLAAKS